MTWVPPNHDGAIVRFRARYENFIGGDWVKPAKREYLEDVTPVTGRGFCEVARASGADVEMALDAAHGAKADWDRTAPSDRAKVLREIAARIERNLAQLAVAESWESGRPIRETLGRDLPLAVDHFRCCAECLDRETGARSVSEIDGDRVVSRFDEPLGVVAQLVPSSYPLLMTAWKLAPALAAGNCVILKAAEPTPAIVSMLMDLVGDLLSPGVVNVVSGLDSEAGKALVANPRVAKIAVTGEKSRSTNVFFEDVLALDDDFAEKAIEGFVLFALNHGDVCTAPTRALVQESIAGRFLERAVARTKRHRLGNPLDLETTVGAQPSSRHLERLVAQIESSIEEGAELLAGGARAEMPGNLSRGFYLRPTILRGAHEMEIWSDEIGGPLVSVTTFRDFDHAMQIANDVPLGFGAFGAGVWTRDAGCARRAGRAIERGRVWTNGHLTPAHAVLGGSTWPAHGFL